MTYRRIRAFAVVATGTAVILLTVLAPAARAATAFDLVISGPGMRHPVTLRWGQIARAGFFKGVVAPTGSLGPAYDLKALTFIPTSPPHRTGTQHWTYYPRRDVVRFVDAHARTSWGQPVVALRSLLDGAVASGKGRSIVGLAFAGVLVFLVMLAQVLVRRRRPRPTAALTRSESIQSVGA